MSRKEIRTWTVRNLAGQLIGRFHAHTADQALTRAIDSELTAVSTFKRSMRMTLRREELSAKVEG